MYTSGSTGTPKGFFKFISHFKYKTNSEEEKKHLNR